jgi:Flp pilus assembly protein TadD
MDDDRDRLASPTLAELYVRQGDLGQAVRILKQVLALNPGNASARARLGELEERIFADTEPEARREKVRRLKAVLERVRKEKSG